MSELRTTVVTALEALQWSYRADGAAKLVVSIPPIERHRFGDRSTVSLVFDVDTWQQDRRVDLVAPGSAFLQGLEEALAARTSRSVRFSGTLAPRGALGEEWARRMQVVNAETVGFDSPIRYEYAVRWLFEVDLPGPPRTTTLVPVALTVGGRELTPTELSGADPAVSYALDDVIGLLPEAPAWPEASTLEGLRAKGVGALASRVAGPHAAQAAVRATLLRTERAALEQDRMDRLGDMSVDPVQVEGEYASRLAALDARFDAGVEARIRTETLLVMGREGVKVRLKRRDGKAVALSPRLLAGALRDDQCFSCSAPANQYALTHEEQPRLLCPRCGFACASPECSAVEPRATVTCSRCTPSRYCQAHSSRCAACGGSRCPEHSSIATCCSQTLCEQHALIHSVTKATICGEHASRCAHGEHLVLKTELLPCAATGRLACAAHLAPVDDPAGAKVLSTRVRVCAESHRRLDQDRVTVCSVDGGTYERSLLLRCALTGRLFHPRHAVTLLGDERAIHPSQVVRCHVSGLAVARDRVVADEFEGGAALHPSEAAQCSATGRWTARRNMVVPACCGRPVARSEAGPSTLSGAPVCSRCAVACEGHPSRLLPSEVGVCELGGGTWCLEHLRHAACGASVSPPQAVQLADGRWECRRHYAECADSAHVVPVEHLLVCSRTGAPVCEEHRARCSCHQGVVARKQLRTDAYDGSLWCADHTVLCPRCGVVAGTGARPSAVCRWCQAEADLATLPADFAAAYQRHVRPLLPWYSVTMGVVASGTSDLRVFGVRTLTGQLHRFRIWQGRVYRANSAGAWDG